MFLSTSTSPIPCHKSLISALLLVFTDFSKAVEAKAKRTTRFKIQLKRLQNTLQNIELVISETRRLRKVLDRPQNDTIRFISYLKRGKRLLLKTSRITFRNKYQNCAHSAKLTLLNNKLVWFFQTSQMMSGSIGVNDSDGKVNQLLSAFTNHASVGCDLDLEELTLDIMSDNYSVPEFDNDRVKVLSITGHGDHPSRLLNLSSIASLPNLTTLKLEHVSVLSLQPVFGLKNLKQLSFNMCEIGSALMSFTTEPIHTMQSLKCLEFNMCYDLKELPSGICNLVHLQKLSITNCNELDVLPKRLGDLSNLESLNLHCCTKLQEFPQSIGSLRNLSSIDISDCLSLSGLPEEIGELHGLQMLKTNGCTGLQELPMSISKLLQLEEVICDEETSYLWMDFESDLHNLKIDVVEDDRLESFLKIVQ